MISVIVPAYNSEAFLAKCLDSILSQEGLAAGMEVIVIDDGSTDTTGSIADDYACRDTRIHVLHTSNGGPSRARNIGMDMARGNYLCFVDSDDILFPGALRGMRDALDSTDAEALATSMILGEKCPAVKVPSEIRTVSLDRKQALAKFLYQEVFFASVWAKLFRREAIGNLRFVEGLYYEDLEFNFRFLSRCSSIVFATIPVYFYRQHPRSILHTWSTKRTHVLDVVDDIEYSVSRNVPELSLAAADRKFAANFNIFILASREHQTNLADKCWKVIRNYRKSIICDSRSRLKNKVGAILSYTGRKILLLVSRYVY